MAITDNDLRSTRFGQQPAADFVTNKMVAENIVEDFKRLITEINTIVGGDVTGSGTQNYIAKWNTIAGDNIGNSQLFDNGTSVGLGTIVPSASAKLDITSTTQGFLAPRMTTIQRDAIAAPATGLWIYNTTTSLFNYYDGAWQSVDSSTTADTLAAVLASGNDTGGATIKRDAGLAGVATFDIKPIGWTINSSNAGFAGLEYVSDFSANYSSRSLIDKGYAVATFVPLTSGFVNGGNTFGGDATIGTNDAFNLLFETSGTEKMRLTTTGRLGLNTTVLNNLVNITESTSNKSLVILNDNNSGTLQLSSYDYPIIDLDRPATSTRFQLRLSATDELSIVTANDDGNWNFTNNTLPESRFYIASNKTIGINNSSPTASIHSIGLGATSATYSLKIQNSATTDLFQVRDDGFIYAGLTNGSMSIGNGAGFISSLIDNTFVGVNSGRDVTTGEKNTAIGSSSMRSITSGIENVAIGRLALFANTTGFDNTAVGYFALGANTTGAQNVAIGKCLLSNTTGDNNIAIGQSAMTTHISGSDNIGIGALALGLHSTGLGNTSIGREAGFTNSTGDQNIFLGYQAGYFETSSNKLFIDNIKRASEADGRVKALVYGEFASTTASQILRVNANLGVLNPNNFGTSADGVFAIGTGTPPSTSPADNFQMYSKDWNGAATATLHVRNEEGHIFIYKKSAAYTPTNVTTDRSFDANSTTLDEIADVLGTVIADLQGNGLLG